MRPKTAEKILRWLLVVLGGMASLALLAAVMPTAWMEETTVWLGLEPLPRTPLTQYLTRSLSLVYGVFGLVVLYLARHLRTYLRLVALISAMTAALGIALTVLDAAIGMPASWTWTEGPPTAVTGLVMVWLARRAGAGQPG